MKAGPQITHWASYPTPPPSNSRFLEENKTKKKMLLFVEALQCFEVLLQAYMLSPVEVSVEELRGGACENVRVIAVHWTALCETPLRIILLPDGACGRAAGHFFLFVPPAYSYVRDKDSVFVLQVPVDSKMSFVPLLLKL